MEPTPTEYESFITDPLRHGVWDLRIELSEKHYAALSRNLNLEEMAAAYRRRPFLLRYRGKRHSRGIVDERPALIIPRLFAYLRATIPQKERDGLQDLSESREQAKTRSRRFSSYRLGYSVYNDLLIPPPRLGTSKLRAMAAAGAIYREHFLHCSIAAVPENPVKVDFFARKPLLYFQIVEELPTTIRILSPCEHTLISIHNLLEAFSGDKYATELTKLFSPENTLMEMYLPMFRLVSLPVILKDRTAANNVAQALDEADEDRFVHSVRATGIAAEELLVEIYETFLREKAPEAPLGNLINQLYSRLQEILIGAKPTKENAIVTGKKSLGKILEQEKKHAAPDRSVLELIEALQKCVIAPLEGIQSIIDELPVSSAKNQNVALFPCSVQRSLSELVLLRNRVSHRVERGASIAAVGYVEAAIALRDFLVIALWWGRERGQINYKSTRKAIIQETVKRSRAGEQADVEAR